MSNTTCNLDARIQSWRNTLEARGTFDSATLDELESHLWDTIDGLIEQGSTEREAFVQACFHLGHADALAQEYQKIVYWSAPERSWSDHLTWPLVMLTNYLKIAFRTLRKQKIFSFVNGAGLTLGIVACLLILQYIDFELSYDAFHEQADDLYRLTNDRYQNGELIQHGVITYPSVAKAMQRDYPEVLNYARVTTFGQTYLRYEDLGFEESNVISADSAFLSMFSFPLLEGNPQTALAKPYSLLLSESLAEKYFGSNWQQGILGKVVNIENRFEVTVTGVFEEVPTNSHMQFDFIISYATLGAEFGEENEDSWTNSNFMAYLQLAPGTNPALLEQKFLDFSDRYFEGTEVSGSLERFHLQPLKDIHLYSDYEYEAWAHGNGTAVWTMLLIAAFILTIAWVNYVNLATARAMERAREVGVRKVLGAERWHILKQFLLESFLLNTLGFLAALPIVLAFQPLFDQVLGISLSGSVLTNKLGLAFLIVFGIGTLISGLYPALMLSSFRPASVLKGQLVKSTRGALVRKGLVVFQFALSFGLIAGTLAVYQQIQYMKDKDLGMNIDQMLVLQGPRLTPWDSTYFNNIGSFKDEVRRIPGILHATTSQRAPGNRTGRIFDVRRTSGPSDVQYTTASIGVDHDFFDAFEMEFLAGRSFRETDHNLSFDALSSVIINESTSQLLGFASPDQALSEHIQFWEKEWEIVGVVSDHHQESLKVAKEPIIYPPLYSTFSPFFIKVSPDALSESLGTLEQTYLSFFPGNAFNHYFLDASFNAQYAADQTFRNLAGLLASLGVVLACLGLFGLSVFMTAQRTKEIGVRKVLGASVPSLLGLLVKNFVLLVAIATLVAVPLTYFALAQWLAGYAYHIDVGWLFFALPALLVLILALVTVSVQTLKAALANPVKSLRYE